MDLSPDFCSSSSGRMLKMLCVETAVFLQTATCQKAVEEIRVKVRDTGKKFVFWDGSYLAQGFEVCYIGVEIYCWQNLVKIAWRMCVSSHRGNMVDAFRTHIMQTKDLGTCPVRQIGGCSFLYMRISNVYIVTVVSTNANAACAFKFVVEVKLLIPGLF